LYQGKRARIAQDLYFNIYWPEKSLEGIKVSDFNTSSIVFQLVYKNVTYLFTGDISKSVENKLIDSDINIDSDVLKVAHHGSKTSTSDDFLKVVSPQVAVISVGAENRYGHPTPEVLKNLENNNIKYLRTDQLGDIKIVSDGNSFKINNF
jgi:competence protein ComEC